MSRNLSSGLLVALALLAWSPAMASAQGTGTVTGRVVDAGIGPLEGAQVQVEGTKLEAWTDSTGRFRLSGVPAGKQTLVVSFVGFSSREPVEVAAGGTADRELRIQLRFTDSVTVIQPLLEGQARALAQQRASAGISNYVASDQISSFPDPNVAEATQRIPGVSLQRDDGEGSVLVIRGVDPRFNSVMINGERIPSTSATDRTVNMISVPTEILQGIEVRKAITPDQDGDAIGGAVNLVTKQAPDKQRIDVAIEGGYNDLVDAGTAKGSFTLGRRFADGVFGVVASGSAQDENRGEDNWVNTYVGTALNEIELIDAVTSYQRYSGNAAFDWLSKASGNTAFLRATYTRQDHDKIRRRVRLRNIATAPTGGGEFRPEIRDRDRVREIWGASTGGRIIVRGRSQIDVQASYGVATVEEPNTVHSRFRHRNATYTATIGEGYRLDIAGNVDPTKAAFSQSLVETWRTRDRDITGQGNLTVPFGSVGTTGFWKFGAKIRDKEKRNAQTYTTYTGSGVPPLSAFTPDFDVNPWFEGKYAMPGFPSLDDNQAMIGRYGLTGVVDHTYDPLNYVAGETIAAGYGMAEVRPTPRLTLTAGARYEQTWNDYVGSIVVFSESGAYVRTEPSSQQHSYGSLLPMVHARVALSDTDNIRAAVTRTLARPDYWSLVPYQQINPDSNRILRGNPNLQETNAWGADLMAEHYFSTVGIASAGVFYKNLDDYIYLYAFDETIDGETYRVQEPRNGPAATVYGVELALQNRLSFLPGPLAGIGIYTNYTYSKSNARYPGRPEGTLPGQAEHTANFAVSYEKGGFSGRVAYNYVGTFLADVTDVPDGDVWWDSHGQMDVFAQYRLSSTLSLYTTLININKSRDRGYLTIQARPEHDEMLSWWGTIGFRLTF